MLSRSSISGVLANTGVRAHATTNRALDDTSQPVQLGQRVATEQGQFTPCRERMTDCCAYAAVTMGCRASFSKTQKANQAC